MAVIPVWPPIQMQGMWRSANLPLFSKTFQRLNDLVIKGKNIFYDFPFIIITA
jgi:hypothetical protein